MDAVALVWQGDQRGGLGRNQMESTLSFAITKSEVGIDPKSNLVFDPGPFVRSHASACSFNPAGKLGKSIDVGIGSAANLAQGCIVLNVLPEVVNWLGRKEIRCDVANECRNKNSRPARLKCK